MGGKPEFFSQSSEEDPDAERDNVLNLFYSQFGKPKIVEVCFESLNKKGIERERMEIGDS